MVGAIVITIKQPGEIIYRGVNSINMFNKSPKPHTYVVCSIHSNILSSDFASLNTLSHNDASKIVTMENFLRPAKHYYDSLSIFDSLSCIFNFLVLSFVVCVCTIISLMVIVLLCSSSQQGKIYELPGLSASMPSLDPNLKKRKKEDSILVQKQIKKQKKQEPPVLDLGYERSIYVHNNLDTVTLYDRNDPTGANLTRVFGLGRYNVATLANGSIGLQYKMSPAMHNQASLYREKGVPGAQHTDITKITPSKLITAGVSLEVLSGGLPIQHVHGGSGTTGALRHSRVI